MEANQRKGHIQIDGYFEARRYEFPRGGGGSTAGIVPRNRHTHGQMLLQQLNALPSSPQAEIEPIPDEAFVDDSIYVHFVSEWGYELKFESYAQEAQGSTDQILNLRHETRQNGGNREARTHATLCMKPGEVSRFVRKVEAYIERNHIHSGQDTGNPQNNFLVSNIAAIQRATLKAFWVDSPAFEFPDENEVVWWEVWFRRTSEGEQKLGQVLQNLRLFGADIGRSKLTFAEHFVRLVRGTAIQLSQSLLLLDNLSELRKPQEISSFLVDQADIEFEQEVIQDILDRIDDQPSSPQVRVCLLDSGVNNGHPLISRFLPEERLYTYHASWGVYDTHPQGGHGTPMAGLLLYGDLNEIVAGTDRIRILHSLESFKVFSLSHPTDPELYGAITQEACNTPVIDHPEDSRVFCLAVTSDEGDFHGRPSTWSASIDRLCYGDLQNAEDPRLFLVSGGNVTIYSPSDYPNKNHLESVQDPAQAFNALTVGTYTRRDHLPAETGYRPLAASGAMAPSNSTSLTWENQWPIKPEIVMEGGNLSANDYWTTDHQQLRLLSLDKDFPQKTFLPFGDTSGATALAARFAAQLMAEYPAYWPETIRALMAHSAEWTAQMTGGVAFSAKNSASQRTLMRSVGYGVPNWESALYSANNRLTLIAEREIQPYGIVGTKARYKDFHLYRLPWPVSVLQNELAAEDVRLKVTLSYFIEPNPGSRTYSKNFSYQSHALDFAVIKRGEREEVFRRRISSYADLPEDEVDHSQEPWDTKQHLRNKGSIKKDFITSLGADLATRHILAVYPKRGWYKTRKRLGKAETVVRYTLIVSLETERQDIDLYSPVLAMVENVVVL